jgi:cation:H+ antiporter
MAQHYAALVVGVLCAAIGGELFVRGTVELARSARVSAGIIAVTVAAFATSSPELSIAISSAMAGEPEISLGDALGSNVVNLSLVLGAALVISAIHTERAGLQRDFPVALVVPIGTGILCMDGLLSRFDGAVLLTVFLWWLVATVVQARERRDSVDSAPVTRPLAVTIGLCGAGIALLVAGGRLIVSGATGIAALFGIGEFFIGATVVAVGTSVPELATTMISKARGYDEIGLGTVLGSNIFNGLLIIGVASCIRPIAVDGRAVLTALVFGVAALVCSYPRRNGVIARPRGALLLALYPAYVAFLHYAH